MESLLLSNLISPPLLFFFLGAAAAFARSDLEIPGQVARFLTIYLLFAIGFKGGVALASSHGAEALWRPLLPALILAVLVPLYVFYAVRRRIATADAAAIAATYGSVSAVTFVTCASYLDANGIAWSGVLVAAMALMESPAIVLGILLYRMHAEGNNRGNGGFRWSELLRESVLNGSVFLLVGSMIVGWLSGPAGMEQVSGFVNGIFIGMLCLFLLDMGIVAARRLKELRRAQGPREGGALSPGLALTSILIPVANALLAVFLAWLLELPEGDALLLTILGASASYIAVPAAMRLALPEANPSIYLSMSLAITFPFNLLVGIPLYHQLIRAVGLS